MNHYLPILVIIACCAELFLIGQVREEKKRVAFAQTNEKILSFAVAANRVRQRPSEYG